MEDHWVNKNIDLSLIANRLVGFFEKRKFVSSQENSENGHHVIVLPSPYHDIIEEIHVYISGQPNDFTVKFDSGSRSRTMVRHGILTTVFGGGRLTLKGLKSQEELEKIEKEFWVYLDETIWSLANPAGDSTKR
jgi:hypothetical protein